MPPRHLHATQNGTFNFDITNILFRCLARMYEHTSEPLKGVLETALGALQKALPSQKRTVDSHLSRVSHLKLPWAL